MLSTNFECVYTDMDFGWSGIHFSDESRTDGRYRVELVDAIAQWRDMHPDRVIRKVQFMDMSIAPRGVNIFWDERDERAFGQEAVIGISDPLCVHCFERDVTFDWLVAACRFAEDSDISLDSRDVIVCRHGVAATFSMCKSVVLAFPQTKLVRYLGSEKMADLQLFLMGEFEAPTKEYVLLKFPLQARF